MKKISFDDIEVLISEPINTDYDDIAKYCDFNTELIQPTGSVIPPYEGILSDSHNDKNTISKEEAEIIYQSFIDEM